LETLFSDGQSKTVDNQSNLRLRLTNQKTTKFLGDWSTTFYNFGSFTKKIPILCMFSITFLVAIFVPIEPVYVVVP